MGAILNLLLAESDIVTGLLNVLSLIMMIADAALVAYAVYMFFMMMTAHDEGKRRNVKKHFFNTLSAIFIILALIGTLSVIKVNITPVKQSTGGSGTVSVSTKTVTVTSRSLGGGGYMYTAQFTISTGDIKLSNGGKVIGISNFSSSASGDFGGSSWKSTTSNANLTVTYTNTTNQTTLYAPAVNGKPTVYYTVTVVYSDSSGSTQTATANGTITLSGSCVSVSG